MVAIKDMEMPRNCYECKWKKRCEQGIAGGWREDKRVDDCPLVEIITCENCNNHGLDREHHPDIDGARYCPTLHTYTGFDFHCGDAERRES